MSRTLAIVLGISGLIAVFLLAVNLELVSYGLTQGRGQYEIVAGAVPLSDAMQNPAVSDSVKRRLSLVNEVKEFAVSRLNLEPSGIYSTVNLDTGEHIMYVVTASEKYRMVPATWKFPVAGEVPYKGFFNVHRAIMERNKMSSRGFDAGIRTAGGWSTLGWIENPLLQDMLSRELGDFVNLVIHEIAHETIYIPGDTELNENLASFIGDQGTLYYLQSTYGINSEEFIQYMRSEEDFKRYVTHFLRGADALDSLYKAVDGSPDSLKANLKRTLIEDIVHNLDTISFFNPERFDDLFEGEIPNNTYFLSFVRYRSGEDKFMNEFRNVFQEDLGAYISALKLRYQ